MESDNPSTSAINEDPPKRGSRFSVPVEPILFVIFFSSALTESSSTSVLLVRTCRVWLGFNKTECSGILSPDIEKESQYYVSDIVLAKAMIEAFFPALMSLFIGPWSDANGRRPFMLSSLLGYLLSSLCWLLFICLPDVSPLYFILPSIPIALSGGSIAVFTCVFSYLSDFCTERNRAFRMAMAQCSILVAIVGGYFVSTEMFFRFSDRAVIFMFAIAAVSLTLTFLYVVFVLPETVDLSQDRRSFFNLENVREVFVTVFLKRPNNTRPVVLLLMLMSGLSIMVFQGETAFRFLSLREMFAWSPSKYNLFFMVSCILGTFATISTVYLLKSLLQLGEIYICAITSILATVSGILTGLSKTNFTFMIFINVGCLSILLNPMIKAELAKIIPKGDMGKVYAFISTLDALAPLLATPAYKFLYDRVLSSMPLAIFFLSASIWALITLLIFSVITIRALRGVHYLALLEEPSSNTPQDISLPS